MKVLVNLMYSVWKDSKASNYIDAKIMEPLFNVVDSHTIEMWESQERIRVKDSDESMHAVQVKVIGFYKLDK